MLVRIWLGLVVFAFSAFTAVPVSANDLPSDKMTHFGVAATAQTTCAMLGRSVSGRSFAPNLACFALVNLAGLAKEMTDPRRGGNREAEDLFANMAGSGLSFLTISLTF